MVKAVEVIVILPVFLVGFGATSRKLVTKKVENRSKAQTTLIQVQFLSLSSCVLWEHVSTQLRPAS